MTAPMRRLVVTTLVVAALVAPAIVNRDGFPLSIYPMYAGNRGDVVAFVTAVGIDEDGTQHRLSLRVIADTDDPLIAASRLRQEARAGRTDLLCREIAERVDSELSSVEVVEERHDVVERTADRVSLVGRLVLASCEVTR